MTTLRVHCFCILFVAFCLFVSGSAVFGGGGHAAQPIAQKDVSDKRLRYGQVELTIPEGYIEVSADSAYYSLTALDAARFPVQGLVRLFIPATEASLLQTQQFDQVSQNIQVTLLCPPEIAPLAFNKKFLGDEQGSIEKLRAAIKAGGVLEKGQSPDGEVIPKWLEQATHSHQTDDSIFLGSTAHDGTYILSFWLGKSEPHLKYGFSSGKVVASAMVSYIATDRVVTIFFNQVCASPEDVYATKARAMKYMQDHAKSIHVVPAGENPLLEDIINKKI